MRIALFGGSFNPPHVAHQLACLYVVATEAVDQLWMVPTARHPFGKALAPFEDRFEMCRRAAAPLGGLVEVSRVEQELGGASRTLQTVRHLRAARPADRFALVVGADLLAERDKWLGWDELMTLVELIVLERRGFSSPGPPPKVELPEVSSTEVRARLARGEDVARLVPAAVLEWIRTRGLYTTSP